MIGTGPFAPRAGIQQGLTRLSDAEHTHDEQVVACRHTAAAIDNRLVTALDLPEPVAEFSDGAVQPVGVEMCHVMKVLRTWNVTRPWIKGLDLPPIALGGTRIDHGPTGGDRVNHLVGGNDAWPRLGHVAHDGLAMCDLRGECVSTTCPCLNPAVEHSDMFVTDGSQHPPQPGRDGAARIVVGDHEAVRCNTERPDRACETLGGR